LLYTIRSLVVARQDDIIEHSSNSTLQSSILVDQENGIQSSVFQTHRPAYTISIIIPVYNEESNICSILRHIKSILSETLLDYELIVINDGSTDKTQPVLLEEQKLDKRVKILSYTKNKGKGHAVKMGVLNSRGDVVCFLDGDLDISPTEIKNYIKELEGCDLVIASKAHQLSVVTAPILRRMLSKLFNIFVRLAVGIKIKDTQSGLKIGNGNALRRIFNVMLVKRYAFDVEMLAIASRLNLKIKESPIRITLRSPFKLEEIVHMFIDVLGISYRLRIIRFYQQCWK
jgi:dolichol-phosphate mannosyltransferase